MASEPVDENIRLSHMFEYVTSAHLRLHVNRADCVSFQRDWRGSWTTHVFFFRCTSCKEVETSIPVKQGCTEFVISHKERLQIAFKRVPNLKLMFWFLHYFRGVDSYRKGNSNDVPYQYVLNGREIREPSGHGGRWRGHSAKAYVFVFFIT
jgi:hypothetical protein